MGVLWLFSGGKSAAKAGEYGRAGMDRLPNAAADAIEGARSALKSGAGALSARASVTGAMSGGAADAIDSVAHYGREYVDTASSYFAPIPKTGLEALGTIRSNLSDVFRAQSLALGAIGMAISVGIASALPATELESDFLGEASDAAKAKASEFAAEQADRVTTVARDVLEAVTDEAERQGLTLKSAKSAAGDISARVGRVADVAGKGLTDRTSFTKP